MQYLVSAVISHGSSQNRSLKVHCVVQGPSPWCMPFGRHARSTMPRHAARPTWTSASTPSTCERGCQLPHARPEACGHAARSGLHQASGGLKMDSGGHILNS